MVDITDDFRAHETPTSMSTFPGTTNNEITWRDADTVRRRSTPEMHGGAAACKREVSLY